jgi:phospholipase C
MTAITRYVIVANYCATNQEMMYEKPLKVTRRDFLKLLLVTGGGLLTAGLLRVARSIDMLAFISGHKSNSAIYSDKIKNIIFFIQENHSFDNLFAGFPGANSKFVEQECPDALRKDPPHEHVNALRTDGATSDEGNCSYTEAQAPNYWKAARTFTLCDNYFSDVRGPSHPNYLMMTAGQSPIINTPFSSDVCPDFCLDIPVLPNRLDTAGLTWQDYGGIFTDIKSLAGRPEIMDCHAEKFFEDSASGTLPNVAWLNSGFLVDGDAKSGHPPASLCRGENFAVSVLNAVMNSPQWSSTALFLVWDDWGGFYDHVEPPVVERWKDGTPFRYGHRVPCVVISPYARSGYISQTLHSHVSLLHFAETIFNLKPLTERDANASDMLDCFDFDQPALPPLPLTSRQCA